MDIIILIILGILSNFLLLLPESWHYTHLAAFSQTGAKHSYLHQLFGLHMYSLDFWDICSPWLLKLSKSKGWNCVKPKVRKFWLWWWGWGANFFKDDKVEKKPGWKCPRRITSHWHGTNTLPTKKFEENKAWQFPGRLKPRQWESPWPNPEGLISWWQRKLLNYEDKMW